MPPHISNSDEEDEPSTAESPMMEDENRADSESASSEEGHIPAAVITSDIPGVGAPHQAGSSGFFSSAHPQLVSAAGPSASRSTSSPAVGAAESPSATGWYASGMWSGTTLSMADVMEIIGKMDKVPKKMQAMMAQEPQRILTLRPDHKGDPRILNLGSLVNLHAVLKNLVGSPADQACKQCVDQRGHFEGCYISELSGRVSCGNCDYSGGGLKCSFVPAMERESTRRQSKPRGGKFGEAGTKRKATEYFANELRVVGSNKAARLSESQNQNRSSSAVNNAQYSSQDYSSPAPSLVHPAFAQQQQIRGGGGPSRNVPATAAVSGSNTLTIPLPPGTTAREKRRLARMLHVVAVALENAADDEEELADL